MATQLKNRNRRGFSMVDVLMAFTILSIGLTSSLVIFPTSLASVRKARLLTMANHLAEAAVEGTANRAFSSVTSTSYTTSMTTTVNGTADRVTFDVTVVATPIATTLKDVVVTVSWPSAPTSVNSFVTKELVVADKS